MLARIRELGADAVIERETHDWVGQARAALGRDGADVIFDNVRGRVGEAPFALVAPGSRFSAHGTLSGAFAAIDRRKPSAAASRCAGGRPDLPARQGGRRTRRHRALDGRAAFVEQPERVNSTAEELAGVPARTFRRWALDRAAGLPLRGASPRVATWPSQRWPSGR